MTAYTVNSKDPKIDEGDIAEIGAATEFQYIPKKYNEKSALTAVISGDENPKTLDFELKK